VKRRNPPSTLRVAIIGAGLGGVAAAITLKQAGLTEVTVFERARGVGGVWWQNRYPGCEVDVPSRAYSYSFLPYDWPRTHARRSEIQGYVEHAVDTFAIRSWFRFGTDVTVATWDEPTATYRLTSRDQSLGHFDVVISCVGMLSDPKIPQWPGLEAFAGRVFHTSEYPEDLDLEGKRVAVVGTGSTAAQLAPAIAPRVARLDLYQREPGWVLPKDSREFTEDERAAHLNHPLRRKMHRLHLFWNARMLAEGLQVDTNRQRQLRDYCTRSISKIVKEPDTRAALTPHYAFGCKRPILSSDYYPMFNRDNVTLIPKTVERITTTGVVDESGCERPADVLILSTGFEATKYLKSLDVIGRGGIHLHDSWDGEPSAFLGVTVPHFPNFFMVYGPNTNGGWSVIAQLEPQTRLIARVIRQLAKGGRFVDTKPDALVRYNRWLQSTISAKLSALAAGCHNYYYSATGKNVTQWPLGHISYHLALHRFSRRGLVVRR
jgi:cation diffusion facilitator CzcD-associated flavoprotein CzcO